MEKLECLPESEEEDTEEDGQNADTDRLGLLEDLDNAVQESGNPEEPLEQGSQHETTDDGNVGNLLQSVSVATFGSRCTHILSWPRVVNVWGRVVDLAGKDRTGGEAHHVLPNHGGVLSMYIRSCR